jgi:DNA-directed RNA polymerase alpha subunit
MDAVLREQVKITISKIEIALGYDARAKDFRSRPNIARAMQALDSLQEAMDSSDEETPLELLRMPAALCGYLYGSGITSIEQLLKLSDQQLLNLPQIKRERLLEIDHCLAAAGLKRV